MTPDHAGGIASRPWLAGMLVAGFVLALTEGGLRRFDATIPHFEAVARATPGDALARNHLGVALAQAARLDEARAAFRAALDFDPKLENARRNLSAVARWRADHRGGRRRAQRTTTPFRSIGEECAGEPRSRPAAQQMDA